MMAHLGKIQKKSKMKQHLSEKFSMLWTDAPVLWSLFSSSPVVFISPLWLFSHVDMSTFSWNFHAFPEIFSVVFFCLWECLAKSQVHDPFSNWTCDRGLVFSHESSSFLFAYQFRSHFSLWDECNLHRPCWFDGCASLLFRKARKAYRVWVFRKVGDHVFSFSTRFLLGVSFQRSDLYGLTI